MLLIVDMQNDFIDQKNGKMPVKNGDRLLPNIIEKVKEYERKEDLIFYTLNIHKDMPNDNRSPSEKEWGEEIYGELKTILQPHNPIKKYNYGIPPYQAQAIFKDYDDKYMKSIEIVGVETNLCVLANAIILQNIFHNSRIIVNENLCTSNDLRLHNQALNIMESFQMEVSRK